jgi:hypothetical protein
VESTMIPEAKKVQFQRFAFNQFFIGYITEVNRGKVWLTRNWA